MSGIAECTAGVQHTAEIAQRIGPLDVLESADEEPAEAPIALRTAAELVEMALAEGQLMVPHMAVQLRDTAAFAQILQHSAVAEGTQARLVQPQRMAAQSDSEEPYTAAALQTAESPPARSCMQMTAVADAQIVQTQVQFPAEQLYTTASGMDTEAPVPLVQTA